MASHLGRGVVGMHQAVELAEHLHIVQRGCHLFGRQSFHLRGFLAATPWEPAAPDASVSSPP